MSDPTRDSMQDLLPGYALGALTPEETRAFAAALSDSPELQRDLQEHRELNALLATAEERTPPPELKARLRQRIDAEKSARLATPRSSFIPVAMGAALAASLLLAVGLSRKVGTLSETLRTRDSLLLSLGNRLTQREATLNAILEPGVQLVTMVAPGQTPPIVQVFFDPAKRSVIIHTFHLMPAKAGRAYQLWFLRKAGSPMPSQVFNTEPSGHQLMVAIGVPAGDITGFAMTEEPSGGSPAPTSAPFLVGALGPTK